MLFDSVAPLREGPVEDLVEVIGVEDPPNAVTEGDCMKFGDGGGKKEK